MDCKTINELLAAYLDKEVTPDEERQVQAHLSACQRCQEEVKTLTATQEELRQALRLRAADASPSPQVWERLHQRLEATPRSSFWERWSNWLSKPVWRAAVPIALVVVVAVGVLWGIRVLPGFRGGMETPPAPTIPAPPPHPGPTITVEVSATTEKDSYLPGEAVNIRLSFRNVTAKPFLVDPFPPEVRMMRASPYDEPVRIFSAGVNRKSLNPGEVADYSVAWDQLDNQGQPIHYGYYYLQLGYVRSEGGGTMTLWFTGKRLLILPANGAIEKTITVNQSKTTNGITVTLERIELTGSGMNIYAFTVPPDYSLPQGPMLPPPKFMIHATAEYSVDGDITQAPPSGIRFLDNGTEHIWDNLSPIPKTARELTFRITKLGDWEGPWEFKIPLE